jgi:membrane protein required for beta-lactamase induction
MRQMFSTLWKTLLIWPACCGGITLVFVVVHSIYEGKLSHLMSDPDWALMPVFTYLMYWMPALVAGTVFCLIGFWKKALPVWSVPISALLAYLVFYTYEAVTRPYFQSGITKTTFFSVLAIFVSTACSAVVWRVVRKHWNKLSPT